MQIFKIGVDGMRITPELISSLLRGYFSDMQFGISVTVEEVES